MNLITCTRVLEIKQCIKLNNNNMLAKKKGEDGYDPAYKYDFIWDALFYKIKNCVETNYMGSFRLCRSWNWNNRKDKKQTRSE